MSNQIEWSDGLGQRSCRNFLIFIHGDEVIPFRGESIKNVVVVRGTDYTKNGKWSYTTYCLQVADGVRYISGRDGWNTGRFVEGLGDAVGRKTPDTWSQVAEALGVSVPSTMRFLRAWRPRAAEALDETESALEALEESEQKNGHDIVNVVVYFGSPSNREISEGYWEKPKKISEFEPAEIRLKDVALGWIEGNIEVVGISGEVLSVEHSRGRHGGYYSVSVAVIPGTEKEISSCASFLNSGVEDTALANAFRVAQQKKK